MKHTAPIGLQLTKYTQELTDPLTGNEFIVRTILPSEPCGGWSGTSVTIREWQICRKGSSLFKRCNLEQTRNCELLLGEWNDFYIVEHVGIGIVTCKDYPNGDRAFRL